MRVLVVAEYYPRRADPTSGIWAHRQAVAARDAGADVRALVLHRPLPALADVRAGRLSAIGEALAQPPSTTLDGLRIDYLRYVSPPRPWSYAQWGAWAAPPLSRALRRVRAEFPFEVLHAHYAVPAGDALRRVANGTPLIVSVHGGDVHGPHAGAASVRAALSHARIVLANSAGTAQRCAQRGAHDVRVVHLGADLPPSAAPTPPQPLLVTVGNLIDRKRHADVIEALAILAGDHPRLAYLVIGDGHERSRLEALATERGVRDRLIFRGRLPHDEAVAMARTGSLFVLPSVAEAFGVSYIEAMAAGIPAIGCRGEDGPEEIAAAGGGIELVAPRDPRALAQRIDALLADPRRLAAMGAAARETVVRQFTWENCGVQTLAAYREVTGG